MTVSEILSEILTVVGVILLIVGVISLIFLTPVFLAYIYNTIIVPAVELNEITGYWKWWGVMIFCAILFKGLGLSTK